MDSKNSSNNEQGSTQEEIVIPPEPTKQPEVPPTFDSPSLFAHEKKQTETKKLQEYPRAVNRTKMFVILGAVIIFIIVGIISIVQISIDSKYANVPFPDGTFTSSESPLGEEENNSDSELATDECGGFPFVKILSPDENQVFMIGDSINLRIELCGLSPSLFNTAVVEYFEKDTGNKIGEFSLHCLASFGAFQNNIQPLSWKIPPFLEAEPSSGCVLPIVNFLYPYTYQISIQYADGLYKDTSGMFSISSEGYTYNPPTFSDYALASDTDFSRAFFIDSAAPQFLKDVIFSSYFESPPLFANYYRWYVIPSGPAYLIDLRDGKVYLSPQTTGRVFTKPDSTLYIVEELLEAPLAETGQTHRIGWFNFVEETKGFNRIVQRACFVEKGVVYNTYTNCIPIP